MADSLNGSTLKKSNRHWLLALLLIPLLCMFCYFSLPSDESYYKGLVKRSPHLTEVQLSKPEMVTNRIADCTYDLSWSDETTLQIKDCETDGISTIDINTGKIAYESSVTANDEETPDKIFDPTGKDKLIATCPKDNLVVRGGSTQWGKYEISLWNQEQIIATFPFTSKQWGDEEQAANSHYGFSPNCKYFYLVLYGDFDVEAYAKEELWVLDIQHKSFTWILTGEQYPAWGDSPVQSVSPSWSPDEQEFVFGDSEFGLEIYNMMSGKRRFIAGPNWKPYNPKWSPSGKWIAAEGLREAERVLILIAPNRKEMASSPGCWLIGEFTWSPDGKQIAYVCGGSSPQTDSLWVWDVEK